MQIKPSIGNVGNSMCTLEGPSVAQLSTLSALKKRRKKESDEKTENRSIENENLFEDLLQRDEEEAQES